MLKTLQTQSWTCTKCLLRQNQWKRWLTSAASAPTPTYRPDSNNFLASHQAPATVRDDETLRRIFDSRSFWKEFAERRRGLETRGGLLQNRYLTRPEGFQEFTSHTLQKCQKLVQRILGAKEVKEYRTLPRDMDRLSDLLCRVIDLVDFIRSVHPDTKIQRAASEAHAVMFEYMNVLNTTKGLYEQLKKAESMPEVESSWNEEEKIVVRTLLKDFAHSALQGTDETRQRFVEISNEISQLGHELVENMTTAKQYLQFDTGRLNGMDPVWVKQLSRFGKSNLPTYGLPATLALRTVNDPETRREIYIANRTASKGSIHRLELLMKKRAELAEIARFQSFAHMTLEDKMAKTPEAVTQFLEALGANNLKQSSKDFAELLSLKQTDPDCENRSSPLNAWDREYYTTRLRSQLQTSNRPFDSLSAYFSLGTVMQGLSRLFGRLYGIRLVPHETLPGETWNSDVRRLDVIDETQGLIGVLYCDLFARPNKSPNPAHFTLRCSRLISAAEIAESSSSLSISSSLNDLSAILNDGMATAIDPNTQTLHQLPTIALICDFPTPNSHSNDASPPSCLTHSQVTTLYHEMGHALHSFMGRTSLQTVAGTRCATDFSELPSVLMEHFAAHPAVLGLFARHWQTDAPLDPSRVAQKLALERRVTGAAEDEAQVLLAMLDLALHGPTEEQQAKGARDAPGWSTELYQRIWNDPRYASVAEPSGTSWHGFFGHLVGYGGVYYSYLFDRAIARRVFAEVFERRDASGTGAWEGANLSNSGVLDRRAGERYRDQVLKWGGSRDGWSCVAGVLGEQYRWMEPGGADAMREVGKWGAGAGTGTVGL